jgi:8-amino-7-oxononanoate synthase
MTAGDDHPLAWIDDKLVTLDARSLRRQRAARNSRLTTEIEIDGRRLVNFGSNDYLGLAADERLANAAVEAIRASGWGTGASPLIAGYTDWHRKLEERLADFCRTDAAIVFGSGYAANVGAITALVGKGDTIFSDERNHASIIDGCRQSQADVQVYRHADAGHLAELLAAHSTGGNATRGRRLIVTDTVFSMDGDVAPLSEIAELAERHGAMLMIDEAHATGVFGAHGRGIAEMLGVSHRVHVHVGTLSKALGCSGGFVAGSRPLVDWLVNRSRPYVFSTAHPAANAAAACAALDVVRDEPQRRVRLLSLADGLREQLRAAGWDVGRSATQIVPIILGDSQRTMDLAKALREAGLFVPGIRPPSVPLGQSMLRVSLSAMHDDTQVADLVAELVRVQT